MPRRSEPAAWEDACRRVLDIGVAVAGLLVFGLPILMLAFLIRRTSSGPGFFCQTRIGRHGRPFRLWKLRTMVEGAPRDAEDEAVRPGDPRVTPLGAILRRASLDELPQLYNVLRGEMSLVGPRPDLPHHVEAYDQFQRRRLDVRPGLTGWAQIHGRNSIPWSDRIDLDLEYLAMRSLALDLWIILATLPIVVLGRGVHDPAPSTN